MSRNPNKIVNVVLTGGPCGGKSTGMVRLREWLPGKGWGLIMVPEAARMMIGNAFPDLGELAKDRNRFLDFQIELMRLQLALEEQFRAMARVRPEEKVVILHDRGTLDNGAYVDPDEFQAILGIVGVDRESLLARYDGVIHLVTAAQGAEEFYVQDEERFESPEEARELDLRTVRSWIGHSHLRIVDNSTGFDEKMLRVRQNLARSLGIPEPLEIELKFLLPKMPDLSKLGVHPTEVLIEQMYLSVDESGVERRIRKRGVGSGASYYLTRKIDVRPGVRIETERQIGPMEYLRLSRERDPGTRVIRKTRICFVYRNQYFELDVIREPRRLVLLEIELTSERQDVDLPPFKGLVNVTGNKDYSNYMISRS